MRRSVSFEVGVLDVVEARDEVDFLGEDLGLGVDARDDLGGEGVQQEDFHAAASAIARDYAFNVGFGGGNSVHSD